MKKIIASILLFFIIGTNMASAVVVQVGSIPTLPQYSFVNGTNLYFWYIEPHSGGAYPTGGGLYAYDRNGAEVFYSKVGTHAPVKTSIFETLDNIFIYTNGYYRTYPFGGSDEAHWTSKLLKYNKNTNTYTDWQYISSKTMPYVGSNYAKMIVDGDYLVIKHDDGTGIQTDITDNSALLNFETITSTIDFLNFEPITNGYKYRLSHNQINYLDENLKQYNYILVDSIGDTLRFNDVFISTYDFKGYNMLYDGTNAIFNLSINGVNTSSGELDMRSYENYEIGTIDYTNGQYFNSVFNGQLVKILPPIDMGYDYITATFGPHIQLLDAGAGANFYFLGQDLNLYKDADLDLTTILVDIYNPGGSSSGGGDTGTGAIDYDDSVFNWDADGDGDIELLNGEIFGGIANMFSYFFGKIMDFFTNIKALVEKLGSAFTSEVKTFSFIPQTHAESFAVMFNTSVDEEEFNNNILGKFSTFFKGFAVFFVFIIGFIVFIGINRKKG